MSLLSFLVGHTIKRKQNNKHEEAMTDKKNVVTLAEQDDKTKIELAKLEFELEKLKLENAKEIAKIEAETAKDLNKNQVNDLRQYAGSREYANYTSTGGNGNRRGQGYRPFA